MIVPDVLDRKARTLGSAPALRVDSGDGLEVRPADTRAELTFLDWSRRSDALAHTLVAAGTSPGDRVAIGFENLDADRFCVAYFAALKAGGVAVPLGARMVEAEVDQILDHAEPRVAVVDGARSEVIGRRHTSIRVLGPEEYERALRHPLACGPRVARGEDDPCDILYTSGTTGSPKGVLSTHANVVQLAYAGFRAFRGQVFLHAIPMWTFAGTHAMQFMPLRAGMVSVVMHRFQARRYLALVAAHRAVASYAVPAMLKLAVDESASLDPSERPDASSLYLLMFGSAPMAPATLQRLPEVFPRSTLLNLYGQTEAGGAGCAMMIQPGQAATRSGSIGKPLPPTEIRIVIEDEAGKEREAGCGEIGEIWIRGQGKPRAYYRDEAATERTFTRDRWVRTGDLGHLDADGYLYLDDRKKDLVIRGGFNIFPAEIDALLEAHPAIREAAVVGVPHPVLGEDLAAFVALRPGAEIGAEELRAYLSEKLADYKVPRRFSFVSALPRSTMGKVLKRALREEPGQTR